MRARHVHARTRVGIIGKSGSSGSLGLLKGETTWTLLNARIAIDIGKIVN